MREHEEMPKFLKAGEEKEFLEKLLEFGKGAPTRGVAINLNTPSGWREV